MKNIFLKTNYDADEDGFFGQYGGKYVPEILIPALEELETAYNSAKQDPKFIEKLMDLYQNYSGRPTPLYFAENITNKLGGGKLYIKNEGLAHTGAHKINHCLGQALLAKKMGKKRLIAETGAGQHGVATATVAAKFGFEAVIYMGAVDYERQRSNVFWMEQLGAKVIPVEHGTKRLKDAVTAAIQDWTASVNDSYYLLGSALGPHPYPSIVRDFQTIVGLEVQDQLLNYEKRNFPDYVVACVGGGSNSIGIFNPFLDNNKVKLIGAEAGGRDIGKLGEHATRLDGKRKQNVKVGVVEGYKSIFIQTEQGNIAPTHSISAGLDYSGVGPQHAHLAREERAEYHGVTDQEVLAAFKILASEEGIIGALESLHGIAYALNLLPTLDEDEIVVANLSGRGDKDLFILTEKLDDKSWKKFLKTKLTNIQND
jgi:tryptophan synthase beta chain